MPEKIPNYARRRLLLMIVLIALGTATGFIWGQQYGYRQGTNDMIRHIEQRLNSPPAAHPVQVTVALFCN